MNLEQQHKTPIVTALQAVHEVHGPVALVHFDAHLDTWDTYFGAPCTHGTPFRRASEQGLLVKDRSAHVGIRGSLYDRADLLEDAELGFTVVHCRDIDRIGIDGVIERVLDRVEAPLIAMALNACGGNQIKAADLLGLNRNTLRKKIRELGIPVVRGGK
jgi:arginase family enzyme